jgi:hypothetical protein
MQPMGSLQPGLPSPTAIPLQNYLYIIDLKDCIFTIPLCKEDREKFASSVPIPNHQASCKHYQWKFLLQGMENNPTMCQESVASSLEPLRQKFNQAYIVPYMDDTLLSHNDLDILLNLLAHVPKQLPKWGLTVAPDKIQKQSPFSYLGQLIEGCAICPCKIEIRKDI